MKRRRAYPIILFTFLCYALANVLAGGEKTRVPPVGMTLDSEHLRAQMVDYAVMTRGVNDPALLAALGAVPRERFAPTAEAWRAYQDVALEIDVGRYMWPPGTLAAFIERLHVRAGEKALVVEGGSGYEVAILAAMGVNVASVESRPALEQAAARLVDEVDGMPRVSWHHGAPEHGWMERAPFDIILVLRVLERIPSELVEQLAPRGRMLVAIGDDVAVGRLMLVTRNGQETVDVLALAPRVDGRIIPAWERPVRSP